MDSHQEIGMGFGTPCFIIDLFFSFLSLSD